MEHNELLFEESGTEAALALLGSTAARVDHEAIDGPVMGSPFPLVQGPKAIWLQIRLENPYLPAVSDVSAGYPYLKDHGRLLEITYYDRSGGIVVPSHWSMTTMAEYKPDGVPDDHDKSTYYPVVAWGLVDQYDFRLSLKDTFPGYDLYVTRSLYMPMVPYHDRLVIASCRPLYTDNGDWIHFERLTYA